jgi:Protein of unknown function (DUF3800)
VCCGPIEIACDESGSEGENLIGGETDVFAYASVQLDTEAATTCVQELRRRIRSPAQEYKANHLLREKHRSVLEWLLGPSGPIHGHAHVHLIDKTFFLVGKIIGTLLAEVTDAEAMALTLCREGRESFGREPWQAFLQSFNNLMRARSPQDATTLVDSFVRAAEALSLAATPAPVDRIVRRLWQASLHADAFRVRFLDERKGIPTLDPLFPAIIRTVVHWSEGRRPVSIIHDRQPALTGERIARLEAMTELSDLTLVDSRSDARVQVADFVAGVARKIASDELNARGDPVLTALLRPYVDPSSIWGDHRSWSELRPS